MQSLSGYFRILTFIASKKLVCELKSVILRQIAGWTRNLAVRNRRLATLGVRHLVICVPIRPTKLFANAMHPNLATAIILSKNRQSLLMSKNSDRINRLNIWIGKKKSSLKSFKSPFDGFLCISGIAG
jgi:hypothetical protein